MFKSFSQWLESRVDEGVIAKSAVCLGVVPMQGGVALTIRDDQGQQGNTSNVVRLTPVGGPEGQGSYQVQTQNSTYIVRMTPRQAQQAQQMMQQQVA
jgi:hypothetical protein